MKQTEERSRHAVATNVLLGCCVVAAAWALTNAKQGERSLFHGESTVTLDLFSAEDVALSPFTHYRLSSRGVPVDVQLSGCNYVPSEKRLDAATLQRLGAHALASGSLHAGEISVPNKAEPEHPVRCTSMELSLPSTLHVQVDRPLSKDMLDLLSSMPDFHPETTNETSPLLFYKLNDVGNVYRMTPGQARTVWEVQDVQFVPAVQ
jgi:hypothetical protein